MGTDRVDWGKGMEWNRGWEWHQQWEGGFGWNGREEDGRCISCYKL